MIPATCVPCPPGSATERWSAKLTDARMRLAGVTRSGSAATPESRTATVTPRPVVPCDQTWSAPTSRGYTAAAAPGSGLAVVVSVTGGVALGLGVGAGWVVGVGDAAGAAVGTGVDTGVGAGVATGVGVGVGVGDGVGDGVGTGV